MADTLSITDNRTGKKYDVTVQDGTIRAMDLRQIKTGADDFGLMTYDPAFMNTANCRSAITFIDGDKGILLYRGYPIEQLAEDLRLQGVELVVFVQHLLGEIGVEAHEGVERVAEHRLCDAGHRRNVDQPLDRRVL